MKSYIGILFGVLLGASLHAVAAAGGVPDTGDIPRAEPPRTLPSTLPATIKKQVKPAYQAADSEQPVTLTIQVFKFEGNQSISSEALNALLVDYQKGEIGFKELNQATKIITEYYRKKGYFLAQAYLPAQDIEKGIVEIAIIEGKLGTLGLSGTEGFDTIFMKNIAAYRLGAGDTVSEHNLIRNVT